MTHSALHSHPTATMVSKKNERVFQNTIEHKPSFDGRLHYFDTIGIFLEGYAHAKLQGDLKGQLRSLSGTFALAAPYIKKEFREEIESLFNSINNLINTENDLAQNSASNKLNDLSFKIFDYAKHIFLPQGLDDGEEINFENLVMED